MAVRKLSFEIDATGDSAKASICIHFAASSLLASTSSESLVNARISKKRWHENHRHPIERQSLSHVDAMCRLEADAATGRVAAARTASPSLNVNSPGIFILTVQKTVLRQIRNCILTKPVEMDLLQIFVRAASTQETLENTLVALQQSISFQLYPCKKMATLNEIVPAGVVTGDDVYNLFEYARSNGFAIPAVNCTR
jgi:hypothetical protein